MISVQRSHAWTSRTKVISRVSRLANPLSRTISRWQPTRFPVWSSVATSDVLTSDLMFWDTFLIFWRQIWCWAGCCCFPQFFSFWVENKLDSYILVLSFFHQFLKSQPHVCLVVVPNWRRRSRPNAALRITFHVTHERLLHLVTALLDSGS